MAKTKKQKVQELIYERAFEIEEELSKDDFFLAKLTGLKPEQVSDVALSCAIKELKDIYSEIKQDESQNKSKI